MEHSSNTFVEDSGLKVLYGIARPLARLMLRCGIGYKEFSTTMKRAFVETATKEFGLRGRSTNASRVAALTGISRREVKRIRDVSGSSTGGLAPVPSSPLNSIIHFWRYDTAFCDAPGHPRPLLFEGENSFTDLVRRYGGDLPASAIKKELMLAGTIRETEHDKLELLERFFLSRRLELDVLESISSSIARLLSTTTHNVQKIQQEAGNEATGIGDRRLERCAWTDRLSAQEIDKFRVWVSLHGKDIIERADDWIGEREVRQVDSSNGQSRTVGIGVYYFEED